MRMVLILLLVLVPMQAAWAGGGPLGIDHRLHYDNNGIWKRSDQNALLYGTIVIVGGGAIALGDHDEFGDTFWRSVDAMVVSGASTQGLKYGFGRERPSQTSDPTRFFKHGQSFPSGEVAAMSAAVTPFIMQYGRDHSAVYALALLPAYDAIARMKVHAHWQSDVLVGVAVGTGIGIWASRRDSPLIVGWLPRGFSVGYVHRFKP
jgi:undecaprenyl-diphosphatase